MSDQAAPMRNRERLNEAVRLLEHVADNDAVSPTPHTALMQAIGLIQHASQFVLDSREREDVDAHNAKRPDDLPAP